MSRFDDRHFSVRKFWAYQHYPDRDPPWVKWHVSVLEDAKLNTLWPSTRLFWTLVLLVAAKKVNVIPRDDAWLAREVTLPRRTVHRALNQLEQAEFIACFASKAACMDANELARPERADVLALHATRVEGERTEEEVRVEELAIEEPPLPTKLTTPHGAAALEELERLQANVGRPF